MARLWQGRAEPYALYYFQWANRSTQGVTNARGVHIDRKGNAQPGPTGARDQRSAFTSTQKADACTLAQTAVVLGKPSAAADYLGEAGVKPAQPGPDGRAGVPDATDICVLPGRAMPSEAAGVLLDYEVQDGRTPDYTLAFLTRFTGLVHGAGKRAILMVNPLDAPSQIYTGVTEANANRIHHLFDRTTLWIWARNAENSVDASLARQMQILKAGGPVDPKRLIVNFELANTTQADAISVRRFMDSERLAGVIFWRDHAQQGGACDLPVNVKIACLALGRC
jgi:hypothetical protein